MSKAKELFQWKEGTPQSIKDLWYWQMNRGDSFNCQIFELLGKADQENRIKIFMAWPELYQAWHAWHHTALRKSKRE